MVKKVIKLLLVISWMGLIFSFSSDTGVDSTKKSDGFVIRTVEAILGKELSMAEKEKWTTYLEVPVRKGAHFSEYLILGVLVVINLFEYIQDKRKAALISFLISFLYACSDEVHQLFVAGRSGQLSDVLLDTIGAVVGILIVVIVVRMWKKYEQKERIG